MPSAGRGAIALLDCPRCRDWRGCLGRGWFAFSDIYAFCWWQVIFIIEHLDDETYPANPAETGYVEQDIALAGSAHALFESIKVLTGEIRFRLETTGEAGEALVDEVQGGTNNPNLLSRPARRVLNYIVGARRRQQTYPQWKAARKYNTCWQKG